MFDVVLEIVEHSRAGAPRPESKGKSEKLAEYAAQSDGRVEPHSGVVVINRSYLPAIASLGDKGG